MNTVNRLPEFKRQRTPSPQRAIQNLACASLGKKARNVEVLGKATETAKREPDIKFNSGPSETASQAAVLNQTVACKILRNRGLVC